MFQLSSIESSFKRENKTRLSLPRFHILSFKLRPQLHFYYLSRFQPHFSKRFMEISWIQMAFSTPELQDPKTPEKPPVATPWVPSNMAWTVDWNAPKVSGRQRETSPDVTITTCFSVGWPAPSRMYKHVYIKKSLSSEWCVLQPGSSGMLWSLA